MPSRSYEWTNLDVVASEAIDGLIDAAGLNNREIDRITGGRLSYGRVRDIRKQLKAPVRLSEFFLLMDLCHVDPIAKLGQIKEEADRRDAASDADVFADLSSEGVVPVGLAANINPQKTLEMETPDD